VDHMSAQLDLLAEIDRASGHIPCGSDRDGLFHPANTPERLSGRCRRPAAVFVGWAQPSRDDDWPTGGVNACWSHANYYADAWTHGWWDQPGTGYAYLASAPAERGDSVWMTRLDGAAA
jgi:hypothetical protein